MSSILAIATAATEQQTTRSPMTVAHLLNSAQLVRSVFWQFSQDYQAYVQANGTNAHLQVSYDKLKAAADAAELAVNHLSVL